MYGKEWTLCLFKWVKTAFGSQRLILALHYFKGKHLSQAKHKYEVYILYVQSLNHNLCDISKS